MMRCLKKRISNVPNIHLLWCRVVFTVLVGGVIVFGYSPPQPSRHPLQNAYETVQFINNSLTNSSSYYYTSLSSRNFPSDFSTPYSRFYLINTSSLTGLTNPIVNIYFCELFTSVESFKIYDGMVNEIHLSREVKQVIIQLRADQVAEVQIYIRNFQHQFRTKLHYHNVFGYNISLEVVDKGVSNSGPGEQSCSVRNCSYAGRCKAFPGVRRLEFRCECLEGYSGPYCQYGPECDPRRNINFCLNGGTCRMFGYAGGNCDCPPGFGGSKCQLKKREVNFIAENPDCATSNGIRVEDRPCSICSTFSTSKSANSDWHRYLVIVEHDKFNFIQKERGRTTSETPEMNLSLVLSQVFEEHELGNQTFQVNSRLIVEVFGRISHPNQTTFPPGMFLKLADSVSVHDEYERLQPIVSMNKEEEKPLLEGQEFTLTCRSRLPSHTMVHFRWYKDHVLIRKDYTTRHRHISQFEVVEGVGDKILSFLMIDNVSPFDMGIFTCQVTDLVRNVQECADYPMLVVVPPQIEVMPMSVTMTKNESKILMCSDSLEALGSKSHDNLQISWYKDQELVKDNRLWSTETIYPQGQILRIRRATGSATFTCRATNKGGVQERSIRVEVLEPWASPYHYCPRSCEVVEGTGARLVWGLTSLHQTAMMKCPQNFSGYAQRRCSHNRDGNGHGKWEPTDFSRCTHEQLGHFNYTLRSMQNGYNVRSDGLTSLHDNLNTYLEGRKRNGIGGHGPDSLLYGEGDKFIRMLEDTFDYIHQINHSAPNLVRDDHILGLVSVVDNFMGFRNSCSHTSAANQLLKHFLWFLKEFQVESYSSPHIFIRRIMATMPSVKNESSPVEIDGGSAKLIFDCNAINGTEMDLVLERHLTLIKISGLTKLNDNSSIVSNVVSSIVSDIVSVDMSPSLEMTNACVNEDEITFQLHFDVANTTKYNKSCGGLYDSFWTKDICDLNTTMEGVIICFCKLNLLQKTVAFAVLKFEEIQILPPTISELVQLPPEWIAASGCVVALVLCCKTLICGLIRKVTQPHFLLVSVGLILSTFCLLHIILMSYCREVGLLYMTLTLGLQAIRIWRIVWVADLRDLYPWLEQVSPWIFLTAIAITQIGPLFTVFLVDSFSQNNSSVLDQNSSVFITFAALVALSVLSIVLLFYKTHIRFHKKAVTNNNVHGDQQTLNETFLQTLFHMVQILTLVLYINLRRHIFFHYLLAITTSALGLIWRVPRLPSQKRRNNPGADESPPNLPTTATSNATAPTPIPSAFMLNGGGRCLGLQYKHELKPLRDLCKPAPTPPRNNSVGGGGSSGHNTPTTGDDDDQEPTSSTTIDNSVQSLMSVSTISHTGHLYLRPYKGIFPDKVACQLSLDDSSYVLPSTK